ncbi:MAG: tetratricopeptide repeat protein [Gammaproteobacteria bacterium]|nr:tetratricopeptide repeat protein [Gammaproteobacteria bacterium]
MDIEALEHLLARGHDTVLVRLGLGRGYLDRHDGNRAVIHLRAAVALDPHNAPAWKWLGQALTETGDTEGARAAYTEGIAAAEKAGHIQAAREMRVFQKRLERKTP